MKNTREMRQKKRNLDRYFTIKTAFLQCNQKLIAPYKTLPSSVEKRGSKNALVQILEEQTVIMQQLTEQANESSGSYALSQVLEQ